MAKGKKKNNKLEIPMPKSANEQETLMKNMLSFMPVSGLLALFNTILKVAAERGILLRDWEHKNRAIKEIATLGGKTYFFATEVEDGKGAEGSGKGSGNFKVVSGAGEAGQKSETAVRTEAARD